MTDINAKLIGESYNDYDGEGGKVTVVDSIAGLAPGYVTVRNESGKVYNENLHAVLTGIHLSNEMRDDQKAVLDLLSISKRLQETVNEIASVVLGNADIQFADQMQRDIYEIDDARKVAGNILDNITNTVECNAIMGRSPR